MNPSVLISGREEEKREMLQVLRLREDDGKTSSFPKCLSIHKERVL